MNQTDLQRQLTELIRRGDYADALKQIENAPRAMRRSAALLHLEGVTHLRLGHTGNAVKALQRALHQSPERPDYLANLGEALRRSGQPEQAERMCRKALRLRSHYPSASINLACCLMDQGRATEALDELKRIQTPDARVHALKGDALRKLGRARPAVVEYRAALNLDADHAHAHANLGPLLIALGQWHAALDHCRKAVELQPENPVPLMHLGHCLHQLDHLDEAMDAFSEAYELSPDDPALLRNIARVWLDCGDDAQAALWLDKVLAQAPDDFEARVLSAQILINQEDPASAREILAELIQADPTQHRPYLELADCLWEEGDVPGALENYDRAAELAPGLAAIHSARARVLASAGRMDEAREAWTGALEINPNCIPALHGLATSQRGRLAPERVERIEQLLDDELLREGARASLHNALGHYCDAVGDSAHAARHIESGNRLNRSHNLRRGRDYSPEQHIRQVDRTIERCTAEYFDGVRGLGHASEIPVFVLGMPRSGTTLTEQILASHPRITGVGERHFAMEGLARLARAVNADTPLDALAKMTPELLRPIAEGQLEQLRRAAGDGFSPDICRIVDKMPDNYNLIGWIVTLFPNARIIHVRRDPRDIAVSCWMTQFGQIRWANQQEHLAQRLIQHDRIMRHWHRVLPGRIHELDYHALVAAPEQQVRVLLDGLGMEWDSACLRFDRSEKLVRTASISQVRQPIHQNSVARWRTWAEPLQPLFDRLAEAGLIDS